MHKYFNQILQRQINNFSHSFLFLFSYVLINIISLNTQQLGNSGNVWRCCCSCCIQFLSRWDFQGFILPIQSSSLIRTTILWLWMEEKARRDLPTQSVCQLILQDQHLLKAEHRRNFETSRMTNPFFIAESIKYPPSPEWIGSD